MYKVGHIPRQSGQLSQPADKNKMTSQAIEECSHIAACNQASYHAGGCVQWSVLISYMEAQLCMQAFRRLDPSKAIVGIFGKLSCGLIEG